MDKPRILKSYGELMAEIDAQTKKIYALSPEIPCKNKCFDCCQQLFPISFVEAYAISEGLKSMPRPERRERERIAQKIAEKIQSGHPLQFEKHGVDRTAALNTHAEFARMLHAIESDCPALDPKNPAGACTVYESRNHDCRTMGASFDSSSREIVGCFRFANLKHLVPKLMNFSYRYSEKLELDRRMIEAVTGGLFTPNILYFTTMCGPFLKDFASEDWIAFFRGKKVPAHGESDDYSVVIDV